MANKDTSKAWFETGDYPTQAQFAQVFEWLRWIDQKIAITDVTGLQTILNTIVPLYAISGLYSWTFGLDADGSYAMPINNVITGIVIDAVTGFNLSVGSTPGGNDIIDSLPIVGGVPQVINVGIVAKAARTVYFSGIPVATNITLFKNYINLS